MRNFFSRFAPWFAALAILSQLQAAEPVDKLFGGFKSGKKFTFTVSKVICDQGRLAGGDREDIPIPKDFPAFIVGQKITFIIGHKGQLKGPGFSFLLINPLSRKNYYVSPGGIFKGGDALVYKSSFSKALSVSLTFDKLTGDAFQNTILKRVEYTLD